MIARLVINMLAVGVAAYLLPGVHIEGLAAVFLLVLVLGVINTFIKPILLLLTLPITLLTLGLFSLVINALMVLLASTIVPGFTVDGFITALLFSIITSFTTSVLGTFKS